MIGLATAASIVATIVGHPFPVACHSAFDDVGIGGLHGTTHFVDGRPTSIDLYGACAWLGVSEIDGVDTDAVAQDLLVTAHEAELARLADMDEAEAQACALRVLDAVTIPVFARELGSDSVARYIARGIAGRITTAARRESAGWPTIYQGGVCVR